jgi:hypothetical protein
VSASESSSSLASDAVSFGFQTLPLLRFDFADSLVEHEKEDLLRNAYCR